MSLNVELKILVSDDPIESSGEKTPFLAAFRNSHVDPTWPILGELNDARGIFETFFFNHRIMENEGTPDLGHIAVASGGSKILEDLVLKDGLWAAESEFNDVARHAIGLIRPELFSTDQWKQFQTAFRNLGLYHSIAKSQELKNGETWVSKVPLDTVFEPHNAEDWFSKISEYLRSYTELINWADNKDQLTQFMVRYPFSISIWDTNNPLRLVGLLVSPFHPLRLAWLASALHTLRSSTLAKSLKEVVMGAISGWQFPVSSPTPVGGGTLFAQPIEDGPESLFVGWSMLVPVSSDAPKLISSPASAVGCILPALAASGLTTTAADEAVANYFAMNPFVSTVIVDLAATTASTRLTAVDEGIIQALKDWREKRALLGLSLGGLKIMDSKFRTGEAPIAAKELGEVGTQTVGAFSWRRYDPSIGIGSEPNIRVLNDTGMSYIAVNRGEGSGVVAPNLLRRLEIVEWDEHAGAVRMSPSLISASGGTSQLEQMFHTALSVCESRPMAGPRLGDRVEVRASLELQRRADWQIVGDAGIPPVALSEMFASTNHENFKQMLWEWNAPMFGARRKLSTGQVAQRPYVVVAESNPLFLKRLENLLVKLLMTNAANDVVSTTRDRVLSTLGARGIGVSALYADNTLGSPQTGAIGFWLAYELIDVVECDNWILLQVPLDKVRSLIDRLGKVRNTEIGAQRADIALIAISRNEVRFIPVEVKCTGIKNPHADFENPLTAVDSNLGRGITQARAAKAQFDAVAKSFADDRKVEVPANSALLRTALLSLIDIGTRLSRGPAVDVSMRKLLAECLERLSDMSSPPVLRVESPVVLSFEAQSRGTSERVNQTLGDPKIYVFQADPRTVARDVLQGAGPTIDLARQLFEQILGQASAPVVNQPPEAPNGGSSASDNVGGGDPTPSKPSPAVGETPEGTDEETGEVAPIKSVLIEPVTDQTPPSDTLVEIEMQQAAPSAAPSGPLVAGGGGRGIVFEVGHDLDSGEAVEYWPGNTRLTNMNIGVFGEMGSGKTQLCLALLYQLHQLSLASQNQPIRGLVLDPKNDYAREEKRKFQESIGAMVLQPNHLPIDVIGITSGMDDLQIVQRVQPFVDLISEVMGRGIGQVQRQNLFDAIRGLIGVIHRSPTIKEIRDAYVQSIKKADTVSALLHDFVNNQVFVDNHTEFKPFSELISDQLLILNLKPLQNVPNLFRQVMAIMVNQYFGAMLQMKAPPFRQGGDGVSLRELQSVLLVDEAHTIMRMRFQQLDDILLQGREFGVSVILSSQFPEQFINTEMDYAGKLRSWFMHRVGNLTARQLGNFSVAENIDAIKNRIMTLEMSESYFVSGFGQKRFIREHPYHKLVN